MGLCLPRSSVATWVASRPSTTSWASMTCQARFTSPAFGLYVRTDLPRRHSLCSATLRRSTLVSWGAVAAGARQRVHELLEHARQLASRRLTPQQQKKKTPPSPEGQKGGAGRLRGPPGGASQGARAPD